MIVVTADNVPARLEGVGFKDILKREYRKALMHATMSLIIRHTFHKLYHRVIHVII